MSPAFNVTVLLSAIALPGEKAFAEGPEDFTTIAFALATATSALSRAKAAAPHARVLLVQDKVASFFLMR